MSNILHTKNKWTATACFILGLMLVLMLSTAIFFIVTLGLLDLRGPEWKWVRIYGAGVEVGAHLWRNGVAILLAIHDLPLDEAPHDVVGRADRGKETRNKIGGIVLCH